MVSDQKSLTKDVCAYLEDPENLKYLSIVSLQELIIAFRTKKLLSNVWKTEAEMISFVLNDPSVEIDNTDINVIRTLAALHVNEEQDHKDPFDHIIIAQAISHKMTLVSSDTKFSFYRKQGLKLLENIQGLPLGERQVHKKRYSFRGLKKMNTVHIAIEQIKM